jgi:hypothetical protein
MPLNILDVLNRVPYVPVPVIVISRAGDKGVRRVRWLGKRWTRKKSAYAAI